MKKYLLLILVLVVGFSSCQRNRFRNPAQLTANEDLPFDQIVAPQNFSWSTVQHNDLNISLGNELQSKQGVIQLLDENYNPFVAVYKAAGVKDIQVQGVLPSVFDTMYVYSRALGLLKPVRVGASGLVDVSDAQSIGKGQNGLDNTFHYKNATCNGCQRTISGSATNVVVENNEVVCVTGNISGSLTIKKNGRINICGQASISHVNTQGNNQTIFVGQGGRFTISNLNINSKVSVINYGTLEVSGGINNNNVFENAGIVNCSGHVNLNGNSETINHGTWNISGGLNINNDLENTKNIVVAGHVAINGGAEVVNDCSFEISGNLALNGALFNNGMVTVTGSTTINGGSKSEFNTGAVVYTTNLTLNSGKIKSNGVGLIVVENNTVINGGAKTQEGILDICDQNGIETNHSNHTASFKFCETSVAENSCITRAFSASGGVDPEPIAFSYPSSGYAYRAFEDLWPATGDYDFNDVVIRYKVDYLADESNSITHAEIHVQINGLGGSLRNGLAVQFLKNDRSRYGGALFAQVSGEFARIDPVDPSVVILNDNVIDNLPTYYNNMNEGKDGAPFEFTVELEFRSNSSVKSTDLLADIFMFRSDTRGLEIHMPYSPPSAAANRSLLNSGEDRSEERGYYVTEHYYPWAIEITGTNVFYHPLSKVRITDAYSGFKSWVESRGEQNKEWYKTPDISLVY